MLDPDLSAFFDLDVFAQEADYTAVGGSPVTVPIVIKTIDDSTLTLGGSINPQINPVRILVRESDVPGLTLKATFGFAVARAAGKVYSAYNLHPDGTGVIEIELVEAIL